MSFVPLDGPARFTPAVDPNDRARNGAVEFTGATRTVSLPMAAALPVLTRAHHDTSAHPSIALLSGAALLGMRLVAAGRIEPDGRGGWQLSELDSDDEDRIARLVEARTNPDADAHPTGTSQPPSDADQVVRDVMAAIADAMPRADSTSARATGGATSDRARPKRPDPTSPDDVRRPDRSARREPSSGFQRRLEQLIDRRGSHRGDGDRRGAESRDLTDDLPHLVTLKLRVEADEEELIGGSVRVVLLAHDERDPAHFCEAALLWTDGPEAHGFGDRARVHASIALRRAADAWPVLERLESLTVPDQLTLDGDELADLLDGGLDALSQVGIDVLWPRSLRGEFTSDTELRPATKQEAPLVEGLFGPDLMFAFQWRLALHGEQLSNEEMDRLAEATSPVIKLRDNWMIVDPEMVRRARRREIRRVKPAQALAATLTGVVEVDEVEEKVIVGATLEKVRERIVGAATRDPIDVPTGLNATLRDYQRQGLTWLSELTTMGLGACLADDMGLGKTITLIALHLHRAATAPTLVVCPASLLGNWEAEIRRFAPDVPVRRFHGAHRDLLDLPMGRTGGFVLTTYGTLRSDARSGKPSDGPSDGPSGGPRGRSGGAGELASITWDLVVADEAQHVKNAQSATAKALRTLPAEGRVALTGTPVENNLSELWAILDWATPGLLGSRNAFRKVWAAPIESGAHPAKATQFADLIGPFLLRRRKSDPGIAPELPDKTETDHPLGLTREQVVLYETLVRESMERIEKADPHTRRGLVLALLTGLKQICNHPAHYLKQEHGKLTGRSEKLALLDELLDTVIAEDGAVLIFTQYVAMARLLETHLNARGIDSRFLHGGTPVPERERLVKGFQEGEVPVFLLSLKAGGTGLNLTRADHVIHFDRWWNPAVEEQATDRAYRIGQTRNVQVHRFVTRGTIEDKIAQLLTRKRAIADAVLGKGEAALTELDDAELRALVSLDREQP